MESEVLFVLILLKSWDGIVVLDLCLQRADDLFLVCNVILVNTIYLDKCFSLLHIYLIFVCVCNAFLCARLKKK